MIPTSSARMRILRRIVRDGEAVDVGDFFGDDKPAEADRELRHPG